MIAKTSSAFVPHRLEIPNKPEYSHFPVNVLFASYRNGNGNGRLQAGSAVYEPDFKSYRKEGDRSSMLYHNIYANDCYLRIYFDEKNRRYRGEKFINGKSVSLTEGGDNWELFFMHFTMLGLVEGEECIVKDVEDVLASTSEEQTRQ